MVTKKFLILALILAVLWPSYSFADGPPLMSLEEVEKLIDSSPRKEVKAYFKSTPRGIEPLSYDIILRGVYEEPGLKVIIFVMSEQIAAGMSGSPVYIDSKLIGALAYRLNNHNVPNYSWGGISPISRMMEEANSGQRSGNTIRTFRYMGKTFEPIAVGYELIPGLESINGGKFIATTSLISQVAARTKEPKLKPGMPIVVDLIEWTDEKNETTTVSAMGTITYIDKDGRVFAFGHPFLDSRKVVYGFRTAEIMGTVPSNENAFKLGWKKSEILGTITFDSTYGIYGSTSSDELNKLHHFTLELKDKGKSFHNFNVRIADSILTPMLAQTAFGMIGRTYGAPLPQESSVTQIESRIDLEGQKPVLWKGLFASSSIKFGLQTLYISSYNTAYDAFFANIYGFLFENNYGLKITDVFVSVNFTSGRNRVFKLGAYKFPNKVIYGQDPVLEVLFVDQNNVTPIAKKVSVKIDWSKVEKPVYNKETLGTEKTPEKIVRGTLLIEGAESLFNNLPDSERQRLLPSYFLGPEDFLENLSNRLEIGNQKVFIRVGLMSRSGLFDEAVANAEDIMPNGISVDDEGWHIIKGGLKERKITVKNDGMINFYVDLPDIPDGYVLDQRTQEVFLFEVVLDK